MEQGKARGEKKKVVRGPTKLVPLWLVEILPLLRQITKIDSGICFGFCVWFCSWVFGARSGCLVLFLGIWSWKWERMTSNPLSIFLSRCHR